MGFRGKELSGEKREGREKANTVPVPFLGLSLLSNPTETLAMQADWIQNRIVCVQGFEAPTYKVMGL